MMEKYLDATPLAPRLSIEPDAKPAIDLERLREASGGDEEFERELLQLFREDSEHQLMLIETAYRAGMLPELKRAAHTIKGASSNVGAAGVQQISLQIEQLATKGSTEALAEAVSKLRSELGRVKRYCLPHAA